MNTIRRAIASVIRQVQRWYDRRGARALHDRRDTLNRILQANSESLEHRRPRPMTEKAPQGWQNRRVL